MSMPGRFSLPPPRNLALSPKVNANIDDLVGSFTQTGTVDEKTQRNDIEVIRQILKPQETIPIHRAYDFRFAREADRQLAQSGWRP
jgi:hypothetical protein